MKQEILLLKGLPASGKTTFAKKMCEANDNWKRINKDDIRKKYNKPFSSAFENKILTEERDLGIYYLEQGFSLIVDDTNFSPKHETFWKDEAQKRGIKFNILTLTTSLNECIKRDLNREDSVGEKVIKSMYYANKEVWSNNQDSRGYLEQDVLLPHAIIVDIDGTIALRQNRSPFEYLKADSDLPNLPVIDVVKGWVELQNLFKKPFKLFFVSGRENISYEITDKWLKEQFGPYINYTLLMRGAGDHRPDTEIKEEIFNEHIRNKYFVEYVLDDRDKVVKMWRTLGLLCLQVYEGGF